MNKIMPPVVNDNPQPMQPFKAGDDVVGTVVPVPDKTTQPSPVPVVKRPRALQKNLLAAALNVAMHIDAIKRYRGVDTPE